MQFLEFSSVKKLKDLADRVGDRLVDSVLAANNLVRDVNLNSQVDELYELSSSDDVVEPARMKTILDKFTQDSDIFEYAALLTPTNWKFLSKYDVLPGYLKIPETITLPNSNDILGNGVPISSIVYRKVQQMLNNDPFNGIDPIIFGEYSAIKNYKVFDGTTRSSHGQQYWFPIPLGEVSLYSMLAGDKIDFPVIPEELADSTSANYTDMPELLYQYEPWKVFTSSGPRTMPFTFDMHRDMWSGDHNDGKANELIRFCEACNYPEYNGSAVYSDLVTIYFHGSPLITGIMTNFEVSWDGPILRDGWYGHFKLGFTITEVSPTELSHSKVRAKPLIG